MKVSTYMGVAFNVPPAAYIINTTEYSEVSKYSEIILTKKRDCVNYIASWLMIRTSA
jgi:hypothetical protein